MDAVSKFKLLNEIEQFVPKAGTNLWDGLRAGMDLILAAQSPSVATLHPSSQNRLTTLFLLTDGMPNVMPPEGNIPALKKYLAACCPSGALPFSVNTFGFGYHVDTPLLLGIAKICGGGYSFIPDVGMVGTVFVNAVASAYAVYAQNVKVEFRLSAPGGDDNSA